MKKALILSLIALLGSVSAFGSTKIVGSSTGKLFNEVFKRFQNIELTVYVDDDGRRYVMANRSVFPIRQIMTADRAGFFLDHLKKGKEWGVKAKEANLDITKLIYNWGEHPEVKGPFSLTFFSSNGAKQTDVILAMHDFDKYVISAQIYLDPKQVGDLISLFEKADATVESLKEDIKKAQILN